MALCLERDKICCRPIIVTSFLIFRSSSVHMRGFEKLESQTADSCFGLFGPRMYIHIGELFLHHY